MISPASTEVEVTASSSRIEVCPGEEVFADFKVTNFGPSTSIRIEVTDDQQFLTSDPQTSSNFGPNETQIITTEYFVPNDTNVGDISTIVVTATSDWDGAQNSAVATLVIISCVSCGDFNATFLIFFNFCTSFL